MSLKVETLNLISVLVDELKEPHEPLEEARIIARWVIYVRPMNALSSI